MNQYRYLTDEQIDRFLDTWLARTTVAGCTMAAVYFAGHVAVALVRGWI